MPIYAIKLHVTNKMSRCEGDFKHAITAAMETFLEFLQMHCFEK